MKQEILWFELLEVLRYKDVCFEFLTGLANLNTATRSFRIDIYCGEWYA
ncbi:MAG: hypothetical protein RMJ37_01815 [Spirochaetia bacterium]|nr:hypothetical protein [Spirochaetota bacterium]MCX8096613.1 hypothetical protein [Spirochaetota bacterium]MDW8112060.1 hypothetical protein [Spirochaetia bacterium]